MTASAPLPNGSVLRDASLAPSFSLTDRLCGSNLQAPRYNRRFAGNLHDSRLRSIPIRHSRAAHDSLWRRYGIFWLGAIAVGLVAVFYARLIDWGYAVFQTAQPEHVWLPLLVTPAVAALAVWLTRTFFRGAEGSGIPQVIAVLERTHVRIRRASAHAAHSRRQDRRVVSRDSRRLHDRPRRADRAGRRRAHVQPAPPLSALERAHRAATRARGRGGGVVGGVQYAARRHRVRDRGTHTQLRSAHERRADHGHHPRGDRRARAERQLHVLRHDRHRPALSRHARARRRTDGGRDRHRRRRVLLAAAQHRRDGFPRRCGRSTHRGRSRSPRCADW